MITYPFGKKMEVRKIELKEINDKCIVVKVDNNLTVPTDDISRHNERRTLKLEWDGIARAQLDIGPKMEEKVINGYTEIRTSHTRFKEIKNE